jgi:hypothetical protein
MPPASPPPPPPSSWPAPAPVPPPQRSRRGLVVGLVGVLVALLVIGVGVAGYLLVVDGDPDPSPSAATDESPATEESVPASASATPTPTPPPADPTTEAPTTAPATTAPPVPTTVSCWDGAQAQRLRDCTPPSGKAGLSWVFPNFSDTDCSGYTTTGSRPQIWNCTGYLDDGTPIDLNYSQWYRVRPGVSHYDADAYDKEVLAGGLVRWAIISADDEYKAALMYADAPWSVTVYADSESARDRGVQAFATMRPRDQLLGTP